MRVYFIKFQILAQVHVFTDKVMVYEFFDAVWILDLSMNPLWNSWSQKKTAMYARRIKSRSENFSYLLRRSRHHDGSNQRSIPQYHRDSQVNESSIRKFISVPLSLPIGGSKGIFRRQQYNLCRFYSSEGKGSNASEEGKHIPFEDAINLDKGKSRKDGVITDSKNSNEHAWLGEQDQQEWMNSERLSFNNKRKESPFLTKRERFKNEFLRRVVPWDKIPVSLQKFPYYIE